jgi:adenosine deaminase
MCNTSMTREFTHCADAFGWTLDDFQWITVNSVKSAFAHFEERLKIINEVVKPRYQDLGRIELSPSLVESYVSESLISSARTQA